MDLHGQGRRGSGEGGYAMAALLVMVAVLTLLMSVAMPVWRREAQREKEEELVFRGLQYVRAIRLYQAKTQMLPPSIDVLVQQRFLRKKYKDPITNDDFIPISAAGGAAGTIGQATQQTPGGGRGAFGPVQPGLNAGAQGPVTGGLIGVVSKSKAESVRIYQGRSHYNEWQFVFVNINPGAGPGGRGVPGGPGGRGQPGEGGRGRGGRGGVGGEGGRGRGRQGPGPGRGFGPFGPGGEGPGQFPVVRPPGGRGGD